MLTQGTDVASDSGPGASVSKTPAKECAPSFDSPMKELKPEIGHVKIVTPALAQPEEMETTPELSEAVEPALAYRGGVNPDLKTEAAKLDKAELISLKPESVGPEFPQSVPGQSREAQLSAQPSLTELSSVKVVKTGLVQPEVIELEPIKAKATNSDALPSVRGLPHGVNVPPSPMSIAANAVQDCCVKLLDIGWILMGRKTVSYRSFLRCQSRRVDSKKRFRRIRLLSDSDDSDGSCGDGSGHGKRHCYSKLDSTWHPEKDFKPPTSSSLKIQCGPAAVDALPPPPPCPSTAPVASIMAPDLEHSCGIVTCSTDPWNSAESIAPTPKETKKEVKGTLRSNPGKREARNDNPRREVQAEKNRKSRREKRIGDEEPCRMQVDVVKKMVTRDPKADDISQRTIEKLKRPTKMVQLTEAKRFQVRKRGRPRPHLVSKRRELQQKSFPSGYIRNVNISLAKSNSMHIQAATMTEGMTRETLTPPPINAAIERTLPPCKVINQYCC